MSKSHREIEAIVEALDDVPIDEVEAREVVAGLGINVKELAAKLRARVADCDALDRKQRFADASRAYADEVERLERRKLGGAPARDVQLAAFRALLAKAPPHAVAVHFHKYEAATDEELTELIRALRHLLGEDEPE